MKETGCSTWSLQIEFHLGKENVNLAILEDIKLWKYCFFDKQPVHKVSFYKGVCNQVEKGIPLG